MSVRNFIASMGCHQLPERSFHVRGQAMPVCARCLGAAGGQCASVGFGLLGFFPPLWIALIALLPMLVDWSVQEWLERESTNARRLVTGLLGGWGFCSVFLLALGALVEWLT